jgi:hypothetical protein
MVDGVELLTRRSEWKEIRLRGRNYVIEHLHLDTITFAALEQYEQLVE